MEKSATSLSEKRRGSLQKIESTVEASMSLMGMPLAKLSVDMQKSSQYTSTGADEVTFLFSANKDKRMLPIAEIAHRITRHVQLIPDTGEVNTTAERLDD